MAKSLPSYIRDSADLLNKIKNLQVSPRAILASLDVVSLYTNIPHEEGISSVHKATLDSESPRVEAATLAELTKIVLKNNDLEFAGEIFLQIQGMATGTKLASAYANVFMRDKWGQKLTSPDWVAGGGIHSASNPHPSWANAEFDQKRLTLALVAHKAENKIPGPPSMAEREKSPVMAVETAKVASSPAHMAIGHAVPEEGFLTGTSLEVAEMETSPPSTPNSVAAGELVRTSSEVLAIRLQQDVALPQTLSKLVWGLLSSLRRDTNTNPASSPHGAGEESQTGQLGRAGRSAQPEGEAFAQCSNMLQLAGKSLMTLLVKAGKIQLRINSLKRNLADGLLPPGFAPKPIPFREATEDMKARWRDLDNVFWKQRTELAVVFETENSERANQEVEGYLESTTKLLREARCTTLGLQKLAEAWDMAQERA
ncbi:hypothetical protein EMCRGX_G002992 [Ephydatia muelleri]